jgi:phage-related protein
MPAVRLVLFRASDGTVPLVDWLERLRNKGHELRRPDADYLRDGVYELRIGLRGANYRLLYFFHRRSAVVISHGIVKERVVPAKEIDRAVRHMNEYLSDPGFHSYEDT